MNVNFTHSPQMIENRIPSWNIHTHIRVCSNNCNNISLMCQRINRIRIKWRPWFVFTIFILWIFNFFLLICWLNFKITWWIECTGWKKMYKFKCDIFLFFVWSNKKKYKCQGCWRNKAMTQQTEFYRCSCSCIFLSLPPSLARSLSMHVCASLYITIFFIGYFLCVWFRKVSNCIYYLKIHIQTIRN